MCPARFPASISRRPGKGLRLRWPPGSRRMRHDFRGSLGMTRGGVVATVALLVIVGAAVVFAVRFHRTPQLKPVASTTAPATRPTTLASTKPAGPPPPTDFMSLVLFDHPNFPTT